MKTAISNLSDKKIDRTIDYYIIKRQNILDYVNKRDDLTPDQIIELGAEMEILESKLTALEIAKEN